MSAQQQAVQGEGGRPIVSIVLLHPSQEMVGLVGFYQNSPEMVIELVKLIGATSQEARAKAADAIESARAIDAAAGGVFTPDTYRDIRTYSAAYAMWTDIAAALKADEVRG